jgi:NADH:ubiquinone oxidoreductase subunit 6 (subunit J)
MSNVAGLLSFYVALLLGACTLAIAVQNPIHSILMLIGAFIMGSLILTMFALDYFALLFLIVYVGAIVVLFLFIVMMLELKMVNISERFYDLFNYRNLILPSLLIELLFLEQADVFSGFTGIYDAYIANVESEATVFAETNLYVDYTNILIQGDLLTALGLSLFRYEKVGILLAALLLFVSMVGSIVLTMDSKEVLTIKAQDANIQALR